MKNLVFDFGQVLVRFEPWELAAPYAENEEEAREKAFAEVGNDSASFQFAEEIDPEKGFHFTVYKSM